MGKAMLILVGMVVLGFAILLWMGLGIKAPTADSNGGFSPTIPDLPNINLKKNAEATADKITAGVRIAAQQAGALTKPVELKLGKEVLEVKAGSTASLTVTRNAGDMKALKLELLPAPGSKMTASGGEYKEGETETTITVAAPADAHDASITIKTGDCVKLLPVSVK